MSDINASDAAAAAAAATSAPPAGVKLYFFLEPPAEFLNCGQNQDFTVTAGKVNSVNANVSYIGANVSDNNGQMKMPPGSASLDGSRRVKNTINGRSVDVMKVPVMLHAGLGCFTVTATSLATGKKLWHKRVPYQLSEETYPPAKLASTCSLGDEEPIDLSTMRHATVKFRVNITPEEIAKETYKLVGDASRVSFGSSDGMIDLLLTVQKAVNAATGEPLTFFFDRVWSLQQIAIFGRPNLFMG